MKNHPKLIPVENQLSNTRMNIDGLAANMIAEKKLSQMHPNEPIHKIRRRRYAKKLITLRKLRTALLKKLNGKN